MNEKQAWVYMADLWSRAAYMFFHHVVVFVPGNPNMCSGLCNTITCMELEGLITEDVANVMLSRIFAYRQTVPALGAYIWPRTLKGSQERTKFCKTQGELC